MGGYGVSSQAYFYENYVSHLRGDVKKVVVFFGGGADHKFRSKNYHILFLLPFDAEAFKTCNHNKTYQFVCSTLSWVVEYMTPADSDLA